MNFEEKEALKKELLLDLKQDLSMIVKQHSEMIAASVFQEFKSLEKEFEAIKKKSPTSFIASLVNDALERGFQDISEINTNLQKDYSNFKIAIKDLYTTKFSDLFAESKRDYEAHKSWRWTETEEIRRQLEALKKEKKSIERKLKRFEEFMKKQGFDA